MKAPKRVAVNANGRLSLATTPDARANPAFAAKA
jgi:hypothetical protein